MAGDLIPPPSPAGRPEPDSTEKRAREWGGSEPPAAPAPLEPDPAPATPAAALPPSPYRPRFGFVLGALIGIALAAVGLGLILALGGADGDGTSGGWSAWQPNAGDDAGAAKQIAEHVGPKYRLGDADQLVAVQAKPLELDGRPLSVAMRTAPAGGDIELLEGHGVMYTLNGLGPNGSIPGGVPSEQRHLLLRREALELALYTFHYRADVDMVVALLPPAPPEKTDEAASTTLPPVQALFYRPGDLSGELGVPLGATIPPATPKPAQMKLDAPESQRIDALTRSNLFTATFQQGQDASLYLVLDRPQQG